MSAYKLLVCLSMLIACNRTKSSTNVEKLYIQRYSLIYLENVRLIKGRDGVTPIGRHHTQRPKIVPPRSPFNSLANGKCLDILNDAFLPENWSPSFCWCYQSVAALSR